MQSFQVWAPNPKTVELQFGHNHYPMTRQSNGWWHTVAPGSPSPDAAPIPASPPMDYGYILDRQGPFPDPRSRWQPKGVLGLSRLCDFSEFRWDDMGWQAPPLASAIIYELHVGTFTPAGTFEAIIDKLDHLVQLGVTHLELMPVNEFSGTRGWGYDGVDIYAPHHAYGGPIGLQRLVNACHRRGLAVLLDVVYNHFGPVGNFLARYGPYFTARHATPWGQAINFDGPDNAAVRRFFIDNAQMWLRDYHFDGLRLDAVHAMADYSALSFLEQLVMEVKQLAIHLGRHLVLIPESDLNDPRLLWSNERGGYGFDAQWSDDFHHALHTVLTGEKEGYYEDFGTLAHLAKALRQAFVYDGCYSLHRRRPHGRSTYGLNGTRFLAYLQNHDQIGNRAHGERSSHLLSVGRLKIGTALVFTSPFIPMLFQGEEWGAFTPFLYFTDHEEPSLAQAVRDGRRKEFAAFGWKPEEIPDPQAETTFLQSKLNWEECAQATHSEMLDWCRRLIGLRRTEPSLSDGRLDLVQVDYDEMAQWLSMKRGPIQVLCNFATQPRCLPLQNPPQAMLLVSSNLVTLDHAQIELPPDSVAILKITKPEW